LDGRGDRGVASRVPALVANFVRAWGRAAFPAPDHATRRFDDWLRAISSWFVRTPWQAIPVTD